MPNCPADVLAGAPNAESYSLAGLDSEGVVVDQVTGLGWLVGEVEEVQYLPGTVDEYCAQFGEFSWRSWRVPSLMELETLANPDGAASEILSRIPAKGYQTTNFNSARQMWYVTLPKGAISYSPYGNGPGPSHVLCVEGEAPYTWGIRTDPFAGDTISAGTVHDPKTGLVWQQTPAEAKYTQAGAVSYCGTLALDGGGWRLPTIKELATIADYTRIGPDPGDPYAGTPFPAVKPGPASAAANYGYFWSATLATSAGDAWFFEYVWFTGTGYYSSPEADTTIATSPNSVRCVR
jgi:hypothetical protein